MTNSDPKQTFDLRPGPAGFGVRSTELGRRLLEVLGVGPPGERMPGFYAAYFRDPDGNKLNAFTTT
jgi:hypothetical protein